MHVYPNYYKQFHRANIKKIFVFAKYKNDKFIIRWIKANSTSRNINDYQNKSKKDLVKALSEQKTKPKPNIKIKIYKKKLEEVRQDFYELRHKFSK